MNRLSSCTNFDFLLFLQHAEPFVLVTTSSPRESPTLIPGQLLHALTQPDYRYRDGNYTKTVWQNNEETCQRVATWATATVGQLVYNHFIINSVTKSTTWSSKRYSSDRMLYYHRVLGTFCHVPIPTLIPSSISALRFGSEKIPRVFSDKNILSLRRRRTTCLTGWAENSSWFFLNGSYLITWSLGQNLTGLFPFVIYQLNIRLI